MRGLLEEEGEDDDVVTDKAATWQGCGSGLCLNLTMSAEQSMMDQLELRGEKASLADWRNTWIGS
jgi:hypothetical protein